MTTIESLSAQALLRQFEARALSPVEVAEDILRRIERDNPAINAFCGLYPEETLAMARASEARWLRGEPVGPLEGVPATIKGMLWQKGFPNRRGSLISPLDAATEDSPSVARLREAGAVFVGRTTLSEFAWKGTTDSPLTGITRNPWDTRKTPGGSSGGAAAAGALNLGVMHLGTDAGGSVRIPASFSGLFGLKPSFGRVPTYPASAFVVLSHVGPLTRTVHDAALMMSVIAQPDRRDLMAHNSPVPDYLTDLGKGVRGMRIAWSVDLGYVDRLDPEIRVICESAVRRFEELGAIVEQATPDIADPREVILTLWRAGAAAALRTIPRRQHQLLDPAFVACAEAGMGLSAMDFLDAFNARSALSRSMNEFYDRYDVLVTPTLPVPAFDAGCDVPAGQATNEWLDWAPYSYPFNLTQQPAATVPCGLTSAGLPVGLQIVAPLRQDALVLRVARAFEHAQPFEFLSAPRKLT